MKQLHLISTANLNLKNLVLCFLLLQGFISHAQIWSGNHGPTLVISSNITAGVGNTNIYSKYSKTGAFNLLTTNVNSSHTLITVGVDTDTSGHKSFQYLNEAINQYLIYNFQRIIILEGEYLVNGPIVIDRLADPVNYSSSDFIGKITIEGEGFGTQIINAPGYDGVIFSVRSYYNTIKNMSIISDGATAGMGRNTCILLESTATGHEIRNNVFENLYLGAGGASYVGNSAPPSSTEANLDSTDRRIGIRIKATGNYNTAQSKVVGVQVENNKFKNITFNVLDTGIIIDGDSGIVPGTTDEKWGIRVNDNIFENLTFDNVVVGVDFKTGVWAFDNVFSNLALQTDTYTKRFVRNVSGTNNTFKCLYNSDWNAGSGGNITQPNIKLFTTSGTSSHTTIKDSEIDISSDKFFEDLGSFTQLINCYNSGVINYKLGFENTSNYKSNTNLLGRVVIGKTNNQVESIDPAYKLIVNGKVRVREEVYVKQGGLTWPDYVFAKNYKLMPLNEVEKHINKNGHLPNMPTATEVEKEGIAVGDIIKRQQEKIEELTLYLIEMKKEIETLKKTSKN